MISWDIILLSEIFSLLTRIEHFRLYLGLLLLIELVEFDLPHQNSGQNKGFLVHLGFLLDLLHELDGLLGVGESLHHRLPYHDQRQGIQSGLEIHDEFLVESDQLVLEIFQF